MKLVVSISNDTYTRLFDNGIQDNKIAVDDVCEMARALRLGTPLDDVKAEIEQIYQKIDTVSHNEYENAVEQGKETAYENVLSILDNIGKAESEDKK